MSADLVSDQGHVIGGYKATLSNPNTSDSAKDQAEAMLDKLQTFDGKDPSHVVGGLKSVITNPNTSPETKEQAIERLEGMGVQGTVPTGPVGELVEGQNGGNIAGGLKALVFSHYYDCRRA
ncbi:MAG: hypothetical protein Q9227_001205 [Pyrenula ochraceoflavens]